MLRSVGSVIHVFTFLQGNRTDGGSYADYDGKRSCEFPSFEGTDSLSFGVGRKFAGSQGREVLAVR
jgi:hypothetical protein